MRPELVAAAHQGRTVLWSAASPGAKAAAVWQWSECVVVSGCEEQQGAAPRVLEPSARDAQPSQEEGPPQAELVSLLFS